MAQHRRTRRARFLGTLLVLSVVSAGCSDGDDGAAEETTTTTTAPTVGNDPTTTLPGDAVSPVSEGIRIDVRSSQPDRVTGSDARIRVTPAPDIDAADIVVTVGDRDVTGMLRQEDGHLEGVIDGLVEGNSTITATAGDQSAIQRIRAWPITGPMLSGPHLPLLACSTVDNGLGLPTDDDCSAATKITWSYIDKSGALVPLTDRTSEPADIATAEIEGTTVPLYVRTEKGVINRSVYEIASVDATPADEDPTGPGWNRRLIYRFGGLCGTTFGQGSPAVAAAAPTYLSAGFAVATASFNNADVQCNDVVSAETTMMVKERFVELFGRPDHTIGEGAGGGAAQVHLLIQNYPGLLDGAAVTSPFPDTLSVLVGASDCTLLRRYATGPGADELTAEQLGAISGFASPATCDGWAPIAADLLSPTDGCDPSIDPAAIYHPETNPAGLRCDYFTANRNQFGLDPDGTARRVIDNLGVQYGLDALNDGTITVDQFLDLNEQIGGFDPDGAHQSARTEADVNAVIDAYSGGRIVNGGGDTWAAPIVDVDVYTDPTGHIADRVRAFSLLDRLADGGGPDAVPGYRIWTRPGPATLAEAQAGIGRGPVGPEAVTAVDEWLTALAADRSPDRDRALEQTRPEGAGDNCVVAGSEAVAVTDRYEGDDACTQAYPIAAGPRIAAGGPRSDDVLKCELRPPFEMDYAVTFTAAQWDRLVQAFPAGVCDYNITADIRPSAPDHDYSDVITPEMSV